jgi:hypothetical protein
MVVILEKSVAFVVKIAKISHETYSLRPKINAILGFKICPTKNATLTNQPQKTL